LSSQTTIRTKEADSHGMAAVGSTPGVGVVKVSGGGKGGELTGVARISNMKDGKETADPHGIAVRK
jgi:hypothetical protein